MKRILEGLFIIGMIAVMAGVLIVPAMADEEGSSEGSFSLSNAAPTVTDVRLYYSENITEVTIMDPQIEYRVEIDVADLNTLDDLRFIVLTVNKNGVPITGTAEYKWTSGTEGGTGSWAMTVSAGSTWGLGTDVGAGEPDFSLAAGTFSVLFTPGKVAVEDTTVGWTISAVVTDTNVPSAPVGTDPVNNHMNWYGELTATDTSFGFGSINLSDTDKPINTGGDTDVDVNAIANGAYKLQTMSGNWAKGSDIAWLRWDGSLYPGDFRLRNDGLGNVATSNMVGDSYTTVTDFDSETAPTLEAGNDEAIFVWVSVAPTGFIPGIYSGTYNVQIAPD